MLPLMVAYVSGFCGLVFAMYEVDNSVLDVVRVILLEFFLFRMTQTLIL
jgi:hypothetical protein